MFMRMQCNVFKDLKDLNLLNKHEQTFISSLFILFFLSTKDSSEKQNNKNSKVLSLPWALPLRVEVGVDVPLLVK